VIESSQDPRREALRQLRGTLREFLAERISVADFVPRYGELFAAFDPPDLSVEGLSEGERSELNVYIRLMGGWFGENENVIPKRSEWKYGEDTRPFSWIDEAAYREVIREALRQNDIQLPD
jgi:hypothetical protein